MYSSDTNHGVSSVNLHISYKGRYILKNIWVTIFFIFRNYRYIATQSMKFISKVGRFNMICFHYAICISQYPVHADFVEIISLHTMKPFQQKDAIIQMNLWYTGSRAKQPLMLFRESYSAVLSTNIYKYVEAWKAGIVKALFCCLQWPACL